MKSKLRAPGILFVLSILFHWKILLTRQFSILTEYETVNQTYSWYNFWISSIRGGYFPLWDPYTFAGHPFSGEMQTGAFYPLNFVLALAPLGHNGFFSVLLFHLIYVLSLFIAGYFVYLLCRELDLSEYPALIAAICLTFGGVMTRFTGWTHMMQSGLWLPLMFLFLLRALRSKPGKPAVYYSVLCGLCLGLSILAGGLHLVILQGIVLTTAAAYFAWDGDRALRKHAATVLASALVMAVAIGAVQLLPSVEYSKIAVRSIGGAVLPADQKIPYAYMGDKLYPNAFLQLLMPAAFNGRMGNGEILEAYDGVLPLLLAGIGIWRAWNNRWVKYFAAMGAISYIYALGDVSLLHGLLYAVVPELWMAREAPRAMYLTDFALVILAGFGVQALFYEWRQMNTAKLTRILNWAAVAVGIILAVPALFGKPEISSWNSFSLILILISCATCRYILAGRRTRGAQILVIAVILFDLNGWDWGSLNRIQKRLTPDGDHLDKLLSLRGAADFLHKQPGPFRVQFLAPASPNIGDTYHLEETGGGGVTMLKDFLPFGGYTDLLNVRYTIKPVSAADPGAIYQDALWKIYQNPTAYPRAWIVHQTEQDASVESSIKHLARPGFDPHTTAVTLSALPLPPASGSPEHVTVMPPAFAVKTATKSLLVLSEIYAPGWKAKVNGRETEILQVDGALRGIVVPAGESRVTLSYEPAPVYAGASITGLGTLALLGIVYYCRIKIGLARRA